MNMSRTQRGVEIGTRSQTDLDDPPPSKRPAGWVNLPHLPETSPKGAGTADKETSEARLDAVECCLEAVETGACSATPAGKAEMPAQSGSGCPQRRPSTGPVRCSRMRFPGGAALNCWARL